jgi:hypothetical protein
MLSEEELSSAVEVFLGYIDIVNNISDSLAADPHCSMVTATLTATPPGVTVEAGLVEPVN